LKSTNTSPKDKGIMKIWMQLSHNWKGQLQRAWKCFGKEEQLTQGPCQSEGEIPLQAPFWGLLSTRTKVLCPAFVCALNQVVQISPKGSMKPQRASRCQADPRIAKISSTLPQESIREILLMKLLEIPTALWKPCSFH